MAYSGDPASRGFSTVRTCFFDLDDTLYPQSTGLGAQCTANIRDYMVQKLGFNPATVDADNLRLYRRYGTTMAGLRAEGYQFTFDDWHNFVHRPLPYDVLRPDLVLRNILHSMPQKKIVFTNGDRGHAARCLSRLGVEDCLHAVIAFEDIMACPPIRDYDLRSLMPGEEESESQEAEAEEPETQVVKSWEGPIGPLVCCKPQVEAFERALALAGADAEHSMMFDDSALNIAGAKHVGMRTCLVGSTKTTRAADHCVASIHNIHAAVPELWEGFDTEAATCPCEAEVAVTAVRA